MATMDIPSTHPCPADLRLSCALLHTQTSAAVAQAVADGSDPQSTLLWAARTGQAHIMQLLLDAGVDPTANDNHVLFLAVNGNHTETVDVLLRSNICVDSKRAHNTPLGAAAQNGNAQMLAVLLQAHANPGDNSINSDALFNAIAYGHTDAMHMLLAAGSMPTYKSLARAVVDGNVVALRALLDAHADVSEDNHKILRHVLSLQEMSTPYIDMFDMMLDHCNPRYALCDLYTNGLLNKSKDIIARVRASAERVLIAQSVACVENTTMQPQRTPRKI